MICITEGFMRLTILLILIFETALFAFQITIAPDSIRKVMLIAEKKSSKIAPLFYKDYSELFDKINHKFLKEQLIYTKYNKELYYFKFFPVSMFPFFCLKDTIELSRYKILFSQNCETDIGIYIDKSSINHIQITVIQYIKSRLLFPSYKIYTLFFFKKSSIGWESERIPLIVLMNYNAEEGCYAK